MELILPWSYQSNVVKQLADGTADTRESLSQKDSSVVQISDHCKLKKKEEKKANNCKHDVGSNAIITLEITNSLLILPTD